MVDWNAIGLIFLNWRTRRKVTRMEKLVKPYASKITAKTESSVKPISGTFICVRPPDYEGIQANSWAAEDWKNEFRRLLALGIDTAIFQGTVAENTQNQWWIYYPISDSTLQEIQSITNRLKKPPTMESHVIPDILSAAQKTGMKIHLGLFSCVTGWYTTSSSNLVQQIQAEEIAVAKDLLRLYGNHPALAGWYISPEIMYFLHGRKLKLNMNAFLQGITKILKSGNNKLLIGISPGSTLPKGNPEPVLQFWKETLQDSGVNVLYPQDAVGQLVNFPDEMVKLWKFWNSIAKDAQLSLWANCENFERKSFNLPNPFDAASFPRLHWQLAAATPYVEKIVCWECMYFLNANGTIGGNALEKDYRKYFCSN
jgi:Domain of unknown function (DUF4434)